MDEVLPVVDRVDHERVLGREAGRRGVGRRGLLAEDEGVRMGLRAAVIRSSDSRSATVATRSPGFFSAMCRSFPVEAAETGVDHLLGDVLEQGQDVVGLHPGNLPTDGGCDVARGNDDTRSEHMFEPVGARRYLGGHHAGVVPPESRGTEHGRQARRHVHRTQGRCDGPRAPDGPRTRPVSPPSAARADGDPRVPRGPRLPTSMREIGEKVSLSQLLLVAPTAHPGERATSSATRTAPVPSPSPASTRAVTRPAPAAPVPSPPYVPLVGRIAAGGPILAEERVEDVFPLPSSSATAPSSSSRWSVTR